MNLDLVKYKYSQTWFINSEIRFNLLKFISIDKQYNILEIGCFEGLSSCCFSDNLLSHSLSTMDCVDPFIISGTDETITTLNVTHNTQHDFIHNIKKSNSYNKITFHKLKSDDFFNTNIKKFNLIYIDGCHEPENIIRDMNNSFNFLEVNGIMWMDDYLKGNNRSCQKAMHIFLNNNIGKYQIIHKNYQLAIKKLYD